MKHPQERILERVTLANFDVQLQQAVWCKRITDYTWSETDGNIVSPPEAKLSLRPLLVRIQ